MPSIGGFVALFAQVFSYEAFAWITGFFLSLAQYLYSLLPQAVRDFIAPPILTDFVALMGSFDGTIRDLPTAVAGSYYLFTQFFPFKHVLGQFIVAYGLIIIIRSIRWLIGLVPTVEG